MQSTVDITPVIGSYANSKGRNSSKYNQNSNIHSSCRFQIHHPLQQVLELISMVQLYKLPVRNLYKGLNPSKKKCPMNLGKNGLKQPTKKELGYQQLVFIALQILDMIGIPTKVTHLPILHMEWQPLWLKLTA